MNTTLYTYISRGFSYMSGQPHPNRVNSLRPRPNRRYFADDIFKCIFENENEWISPRISLKFVPKVRINNIPALVQIMAWRRLGDKPLSKPVLVCLLLHICVTRSQWVKQIVPKILLDPLTTNCRWYTHLLGMTTLCIFTINRAFRSDTGAFLTLVAETGIFWDN